MLKSIGEKTFSKFWIGLFADTKNFGLAVIGQEKIFIGKKPRFRGDLEAIEKYEYKLWILEIIEEKLSIDSILANTNNLKDKYLTNRVITMINKPLMKHLNNKQLYFIQKEFIPENSIVSLIAILNDKKLFLDECVKETFNSKLLNYDLENQDVLINSIMLAIDNSYEIYNKTPPSVSYRSF